ncbi:vWA domain-containing protein [Bacillus tuaregi]|uniref:vWA domain-containing protein n=1 Tax=Bacillus tuaregi TaxID=1816695 RepID=UPI0008F7FFFA|nr:vWA domain-containing protein [Bacillus tuaregi]
MKRNRTELVFILDKSGSMAGLEDDTIGGFNAMLKKQQKAKGDAFVTTVLFDHHYELLHDRVNVKKVSPLTEKDYEAGGTTALLDALGFSIQKMIHIQKKSSPPERADKVLFVITTDGMENASREYTADKIKQMVQHQQQEYGWDFMFLGANIDAISTAEKYGIREEFAVNYHADEAGTLLNYEAVSDAVSTLRSGKKIDRNWKGQIEKDYKKRSMR